MGGWAIARKPAASPPLTLDLAEARRGDRTGIGLWVTLGWEGDRIGGGEAPGPCPPGAPSGAADGRAGAGGWRGQVRGRWRRRPRPGVNTHSVRSTQRRALT